MATTPEDVCELQLAAPAALPFPETRTGRIRRRRPGRANSSGTGRTHQLFSLRRTAVLTTVVLANAVAAEEAAAALEEKGGCLLTARECKRFPHLAKSQFRDRLGEEHLNSGRSIGSCARRAEDLHHWCGNGRGEPLEDPASNSTSSVRNVEPTVAATVLRGGRALATQIYRPDACKPEWSLFGEHCYRHFWEHKTWWDAEAHCNQQGGNLVSIHGKEENEFVFTLTHGLSSWIGYATPTPVAEEFSWTDNSRSDYENKATNCTGRESAPDCAVEEKAQQWYDHFTGDQASTWVCKRGVERPSGLLREQVSDAWQLPGMSWLSLLNDHFGEEAKKVTKEIDLSADILTAAQEEEEEEELAKVRVRVKKGVELALSSKKKEELAKGKGDKCINC